MSMPLTKEELEKPRTALSWETWVREKIKSIGQTNKGITAVRLRQGLAKELLEEAFPMAVFSSQHFERSRCVKLRHCVGSQNYDAIVDDRRILGRLPIKYLEVTQARLGEDEYLRARVLDDKRSVSMYGQLTKSGTKNTGIEINIENEMVLKDDTINQILRLIEEAINQKAGKDYPPNTALIVVFDGHPTFSDPEDVKKIDNMIRRQFYGQLAEFCWLSVVCLSGKIKLDFKLPL